VIRPQLPLDVLGRALGDVEDSLVSILGTVHKLESQKLVILMDDVEHLLKSDGRKSHTSIRSQSTLLTVLDSLEANVPSGTHVLLVGFSCSTCEVLASRCDKVFLLESPNEDERRAVISTLLAVATHGSGEVGTLLSAVVEATAGRSYAELSQYCRQTIEHCAMQNDVSGVARLRRLKARLSSVTPASLKSGLIDDIVDVRVMTAADLLSQSPITTATASYEELLRGQSAKEAWDELIKSIVIPLCRSKEFNALMSHADPSSAQRLLSGGVLLAGGPYSGKSWIANHCACYSASLTPSVTLLDVSCTSLIHKEVGGSERAVHHLFQCARKAAPCILVMDAIENIAAVRGHDLTTEGTLDRVLSTLLIELDGVEDYASQCIGGIAVIGITHDASLVDSALLRPGRLEKVLTLCRDWSV
jgi:SpoVK/Ycf46/Vps4 family AAA+-type ATPase